MLKRFIPYEVSADLVVPAALKPLKTLQKLMQWVPGCLRAFLMAHSAPMATSSDYSTGIVLRTTNYADESLIRGLRWHQTGVDWYRRSPVPRALAEPHTLP